MLVLSRQVDEAVLIGKDIVVTVIEIRGHQVRLGIEAPRETVVDREELRERRALNDEDAAGAEPDEA